MDCFVITWECGTETYHPIKEIFDCVRSPNYYHEGHYSDLLMELSEDLKDSYKISLEGYDFELCKTLKEEEFLGEITKCDWTDLPVYKTEGLLCSGVYDDPWSEERLAYFCTDSMEDLYLNGDYPYLECPICEKAVCEVNLKETRMGHFSTITDLEYGNYDDCDLFDDIPNKEIRICLACLQEKILSGVNDPGLFGMPTEYGDNHVYIRRNFVNIFGKTLNTKNAKEYSGWFLPNTVECYFPAMFYNHREIEEHGFTSGESFFITGNYLKLNMYCLEQIKLGNYILIDIDAHGGIEAHCTVYLKPVRKTNVTKQI